MSKANYGNPGNEGPDPSNVDHLAPKDQRPSWKRVHHTWWFWVALFLMLAAMTIFVLSDNLAFLPHPV